MSVAQRTRRDPILAALDAVEEEKRKRAEEGARREALARGDEIKAQCESLVGFVRHFWSDLEPGTPYVHGWHLDAMGEHLEACVAGDIQNLAINIPPGMMKSLMVSVFFPAWWWTRDASRRFLTGSYEETLALRDNEKMRALVEGPRFQALWGERIRLISRGKRSFMNSARGSREARAFSSMTGGRGDAVIIDDPHSTVTAESDTQRAATTRVFTESIQSRVNDVVRSNIIVVMQRLHSRDVCGVIDDLGLAYERLILPMEFEADRRCTTSIGWTDPRKVEGELLFPERFPAANVAKLKKIGSYAYAGQYQQRPVPREGGMFKREWFDGKIIPAAPKNVRWVRHWDLAATELDPSAKTGARTAGVKMGLTADNALVVAHCIAAAIDGAKVPALIKSTAEVDGHGCEISIPQDPGQAGKTQFKAFARQLIGYHVRRLIETGDKETRAQPFADQCEAGNVYLVEGSWNQEYLDEMCLFPGGNRKDIPDASSGAFAKLIGNMIQSDEDFAGPEVYEGGSPGEY